MESRDSTFYNGCLNISKCIKTKKKLLELFRTQPKKQKIYQRFKKMNSGVNMTN